MFRNIGRPARLLLAVCIVLSLMPLPVYHAVASDLMTDLEDTPILVSGLKNFGSQLSAKGLSHFKELGQALPLAALAPGGADGLALDSVFVSLFDTLSASYLTYDDLRSALEALDGEIAGVTVAVGDVAVSRTGDIVQMSLTIAAVRSISPPLSFAQPPLDLDGGSLPILLTATLPLVFELNTQETNPDLAFYLVGEPALRLSVSADASIGDFDSLLGLTDIHVSGALQSNFSLLIQLVDPDANGQITIYDWSNAALIDLAQISYVDNPGAVQALQASLYLDSAIIPGDPDASLIFTIPNASLMLTPTVDLALSDLGNFTNLNPDDFLSGFAQLAAGLVGLQQAGDLKLPFLQQYLGDAFYFADPLIQFVQQQGVADVVCGSLNQIPPAGAVHNLPPGALVFCQAYALTNAQSVDWDIANGDLLAGETTTTTVGITPGSVVTFTLPTGGTPDVSVHFIDGDGVEHLALPRFDTLQELLPKLISLGGFDGDLLNPAYDSATQSLTYHLVKQWNPDPYDARLDFGDKLKAATHLSGLSQTNTASASFDPQDVVLDIVFGVILADGIDNPANRFFIQVPSGGHIFTADVNASAEIALKGQVGFVQVSVQGDAAQNTVNPAAAFTMGRSDSSRPMLSVDILSSEIMTASVVIPNAVLVSDLMRDVTIYVQPDCNVAMSAGLSASASLGSMEVTGGVAVSWPDAFAEGCTPDFSTLEVVPTADFSQNLFNFDLSPSLFGAYTNIITSTTLMVASDAAFLSAGRDLVGSTLKNLDDGSRCVITAFTDITLTCDSGLAGGTLNYWQTGDRYEIAGDPLAMLGAILDNLDLLTSALESLSGSSLGNGNFWQDDLPLVGFSPQELVTQFREIKTAVDEIRSGIPEGLIFCGDQDTLPPGGDVKNAAPGAIIYCQAFAPIEGDLSAATWSIVGGEPVANTSGAEALATVNNGTASANAAFRVTEAGGLDPENGFQVSLSFTDSGGVHSVFLPIQNPPPHLLKLEQLIESKLGIPAEALSFELGDAPLPDGSGNGERDLIIRLGYGICTEGDQPNVAIHPCAESDKKVTPPSIPINLQMPEPLAGLVGLEASFQLEYKAHAELDLAISLEASPVVAILGSTGVALEAGIAGTGISTQANIGPIALDLGATAILTGTHTDSVSNTTILTDTSASFILDGVTPDEDVVYNTSDGSFCAVTAVSAHTLTCADGLSDDNAWDAGEGYRIGGSGVLRLAAAFTLKHKDVGGTLPETAAFTLGDFVGNLSASLGGIDDTSLPDCLAGGSSPDVCAALSMMANFGSVRTYLGTLTYSIPDLTEPYTMTFEGYQRLYDRVSNTTMNWVLLIRVLPELLTYVEENLDGAVSGVSLPLIGSALDAGADTAGALNTYVVTPLVTNLTPVLELLSGSAANVETTLEDEITTFLSDDPSLLQGDVNVTVYCSLDPLTSCVGSEPASAIQDLRVTFQVGQEATYELPFDLGIPGVPILGVNGALASHVGWHLLVDFGLNRNEGPYLVAHDRADGSVHPEDESELAVEAGVGLGANPVESCADYTPDQLNMPELSTPGMFSGERCVVGLLAFLQVMILDGEGDEGNEVNGKSHLTLSAGLDLTTDDDEELGRIAFTDLTSGSAGAALRLAADANVNLFLYTGLAEVEGFPSVAGVFHLDWQRGFVVGLDGSEVISRPLSIKFNYLYLDAGAFVNRFLIPITNEVKRITSPLMPVIDTVRAPLPVLSDLSRMTGGGDITLISLLELASNKDLTMIYRLMDFIVFANSLQPSGDHLWISLGGGSGGAFSLSAANATRAPPTPGQEDALIDTSAPDYQAVSGSDAQASMTAQGVPSGAFGVPGLSFPFLQQPSQIFGLLMGKDITLVHYNAGGLRATASVSYTFRFAIGPVPMSVTLAGSATIEGHFAIGYDTYGLRQVLNGAGPGALLDGIYIDDLDDQGNDVPEIRLIGAISARAAVDLVVVSAGVGGGIEMTVSFDLDDRPNPDGKLRISEIASKLSNPWCLFTVSGKLEAYLEAFVKVDFWFYSKEWTFELARVTLLEFSAACELPTPVLAHFEAATLILHIGDQASLRGVATDKKDEKFIVRQLNAAASAVSVAAFGVYQEYATGGGAIVQILANAADGNDSLSFEPGADPSGAAVAFTIPVIIEGGSGNDQIKAGDAADTINGGEGNDKISGGGGDDTLHGNAGNDSLDGGLGDDWLYGDDGDDRLTGGAGADHAYGGAGDDSLVGGPGSNQSLAEPGAAPDLGDYLYGQGGADTLNGGWGDDWLYGDADLGADLDSACVGLVSGANALDNGIDILGGDDGDDYLFGGNEADQIEGGPGSDWLCGNGGDDRLQGDPAGPSGGNDTLNGGDGDDILSGSAGNDDLYGGSQNDDLFGGDGLDRLNGGAGSDLLIGDEGRTGTQTPAERLALSRDDFIVQLTLTYPPSSGNIQCDQVAANRTETGNADCLAGGADADLLFGESGADVLAGDDGDDYLEGNDGPDLMNGNAGDDMLRGGREDDTIYGDAGVDTLYGDSGSDALSGGAGVDTLYGGPGDDAMQGNESRDTLYGDGGQDDMVGGSMQAGVTDSVDILYGNLDQDVMVGDNALITRPGGFDPDDGTILRQVTVYDLASPLTSLRGADQLYGNEGNDDLYGGGSHDWLYGGEGDDYLEGNSGVDHLYGEAGQDDLIGGSSEDASYPDSRDYLWGGDGVSDLEVDFDVLAGDNASIIRPIENGSWIRDNFGPGTDQIVRRSVTLFDVATTLYTPASGVIGHDYLYGEAGRDLLYGQGGYDLLDGGGGDDYLEGNSGYDSLYGGPGNDDLIGGTGLINGDPELGTPGRLDGNDNLFGGDGFDFLAGDNAILRRTLVDGHWVQNTFNAGIQHERVVLVDVDSPDLLRVSGRDQLFGEADDDLLYGQGRNDILYGGYGSDYLEGNAGSDTLYGEVGQDDLIGGTGLINDDPLTGRNGRLDGIDRLYGEYDTSPGAAGGDGADVLLGDNGLIVRALDNGIWAVNSYNGAYTRIVTLLDVATVTQPAPADVAGGDYLWGNSGDDILYGQGSADHLYGGAGDDYLEGNAADDVLYGGAGQDDLIGGTGAAVSNDPATAVDGRLDGGDRLYGESSTADGTADGNGSDVLIGDNGRIVRPLADGSWMVNSFNGSYTRVVYLLDVGAATQPEPAGVAGADYLWGNSNDDILYGQGLDDQLRGGAGEDYLEGNAGNDIVYGNAGQDDLIGGTGATVSNDPVTAVDGRLDGGDYLYGESSTAEGMADGDGSDVLIGDNGTITRPLSGSDWAVNSFNGAYTRVITLLDVATLTYAIPTTVYGADYLWGSDNDDILYGQGGSDELHGGAGDDLIEGNAASDVIYGDSGDDDLIGGSGLTISNDPATLLPGRLDASTATRSAPLGENPAAIVPLGDTIYGGSGSDVVLGDNGRIVRPLDAGGNWITLVYWLQTDLTGETAPRHVVTPSGSRIHRQVVMVETSAGLTAGSDLIYGGPGEDDLIGQFDDTAPGLLAIGDELYGEGGEDVLLGDNGTIQEWVVKTPTQPIRPQQPFIEDDVYIQNSLFRQVVLSPFDLGGDDRLLGGEGGDWMHGGAGSDLMNGNTGNDRLFGDDGNDALWGGPHHDHLWGGYGADYLDVVPRQAELIYQGNQVIPMPADPLEWFVFAADDNYQDIDYLYGGWEQDALQADVGGPGPRAGDRMIDWAGAYNVYYLCAANYGERVITRSPSPGMIAFLQQLAEGDGAYQVAAEGSSGFDELAMVYTKDIRFNTNPIHPDHPGHFTCSAP